MLNRSCLPAVLAAIFALTCASTASALHTASAKTTTVGVGDDFYSVGKVKIRRGDTVKWSWGSGTGDEHTVTEVHDKWGSRLKTSGTFKHKFKKTGTFTVFCTQHPDDMRMKVVVKK